MPSVARSLGAACAAGLLLFCPSSSLKAQTSGRGYLLPEEIRRAVRTLREPVTMADFRRSRSLKETLGLLMEKFEARGIDLPVLVDNAAFREEDAKFNVLDVPIRFEPAGDRMSLARFLDTMLAQIPNQNAICLHRPSGYFEITSAEREFLEPTDTVFHANEDGASPVKVANPRTVAARGMLVDLRGGIAYLAVPGGGIDAVELATGKALWSNAAASQALALDDSRLVCQSLETFANSIWLVVLNPRNGKTLMKSDAVVLPNWVSVKARANRELNWRWRAEKGNWLLLWNARAWWNWSRTLEPDLVVLQEQQGQQAWGLSRVSLKSGRVVTSHDAPPPESHSPLPPNLRTALCKGFSISREPWLQTPVVIGKRVAAVKTAVMQGREAVCLHRWDIGTGQALPVVTLFQGKWDHVHLTLDRRHIVIIPQRCEPPEATAGGWVFSLQTGQKEFTLKKHRAATQATSLVAGKKAYGIKISVGAMCISERKLVQPQKLHFIDLESGIVLWERALQPSLTGLYPERDCARGWDNGASVASLVRSLKDKEVGCRRTAAEQLGQLGSRAAVALPPLLKALHDGDDSVRIRAAEAILAIEPKDTEALTALTTLLKSSDRSRRADAADALGSLAALPRPAVAALSQSLLDDPDTTVRGLAATALGDIGAEAGIAVPALAKAIKDSDAGVRFWSAGALASFGRQSRAAMPVLREALNSPEAPVRSGAYLCLRWFGDAAVDALCDAVRQAVPEEDGSDRAGYGLMLSALKTASSASAAKLLPLLWDPDETVRFQAAVLLVRIDPERGAGAACDAFRRIQMNRLQGEDISAVDSGLIRALGNLRFRATPAVPLLRLALDAKSKSARADAALALWKITGQIEPSLAVLTKLVEDREASGEALAALWEMGRTGKPAAVKLKRHLDVNGQPARLIGALALLRMGEYQQDALPMLIWFLKMPKLSSIAIEALTKLGPEARAGLPLLRTMAKREDTPLSLAAALALSRVGGCHDEALPVLVKGLSDESHGVVAAEYLGELGPHGRPAVAALINALRRDHFDLYQAAVDALNKIDPAAAARTGVGLSRERTRSPISREKTALLWSDLTGPDALRAYQAQWRLTETPAQMIGFLAEYMQAVKAVDTGYVARLLEKLKSDRFRVRDKAYQELSALGELAEGALRKSLAAEAPLEFARRVRKLLHELEPACARRAAVLRAVQVLEFHHTPHAEKLLEKLSQGAPDAWLTQESRLALGRVRKR